jgi:hypothetical protein
VSRARLITQEVGTLRTTEPVDFDTAELAEAEGRRAMLKGSIQRFEVWELRAEYVRELVARRVHPADEPRPVLRLAAE